MPLTAMASSEGPTDVSTEGTKRTFKIDEIFEMAEMLAKEC